MPQVNVPPPFRGPTGGLGEVETEGRTVRGCIEAVEARFPGFGELVFDPQGNPHRFVTFFVNGEEIPRDALDTPVGERDEVAVLSAIAGGKEADAPSRSSASEGGRRPRG